MNQFMINSGISIVNSNSLSIEQLETLTRLMGYEPDIVVPVPEEILSWPYGLTMLGDAGWPIGNVACKAIHTYWMRSANVERDFAEIGGMYIHPAYRYHGLAKTLLGNVTSSVFTTYPSVCAALANCNSASAAVFSSVGYYASKPGSIQLSKKPGKTTYELARNIWELTQKSPDGIQ